MSMLNCPIFNFKCMFSISGKTKEDEKLKLGGDEG